MEKLKKKKRTATKRSAVLEELCLSIKKNKKNTATKRSEVMEELFLSEPRLTGASAAKVLGKKNGGFGFRN